MRLQRAQSNTGDNEQLQRKAIVETKGMKVQWAWLDYRQATTYCSLGRTKSTELVTSGDRPAGRVGLRVFIFRDRLDEYLWHHDYSETASQQEKLTLAPARLRTPEHTKE